MAPKAPFTKSKLKIYFKIVSQVIKHRNHFMNLKSAYR